jgi:alpha-mannosidase
MDSGSRLGSYCFPAGFWADKSYFVDIPINLNRNDPNYNMEAKTRSFYEGMVHYFKLEKTKHAFRPFGCDQSHIEAHINYAITDELIHTWNRLGFNETIELKYSTPTRYIETIGKI